jgi:hypothetical protein
MTTTTEVAASAVDAVSHAAAVAEPALLQALATMINKTVEAAQAGGQFVIDQVPDVIRQLLLYKAVESGLLCLLGITMVITGITGILYARKKIIGNTEGWVSAYYKNTWSDWSCIIVWGSIFTLMGGIAVTALNWDWLEIVLAPKLYLIEYGVKLFQTVKNGGG